jgi:hypothetical protein
VALAIREPLFPELRGTVRAVRKSHRLQCAADGTLYRLAINASGIIKASRIASSTAGHLVDARAESVGVHGSVAC